MINDCKSVCHQEEHSQIAQTHNFLRFSQLFLFHTFNCCDIIFLILALHIEIKQFCRHSQVAGSLLRLFKILSGKIKIPNVVKSTLNQVAGFLCSKNFASEIIKLLIKMWKSRVIARCELRIHLGGQFMQAPAVIYQNK